jgi:hypothetical protein
MSSTALRQASGIQKLCQGCEGRKARFRYRGVVRADRDHTLCFECFRSQREQMRARALQPVGQTLTMRAQDPRTAFKFRPRAGQIMVNRSNKPYGSGFPEAWRPFLVPPDATFKHSQE